jgi:Inner membrane protein YqiJ, OB-fold/Inner membrane protein YqiJ, N-terminal
VSALLAPELWPFALATGLMIAVAVAEAAALMIGFSTSHWHDGEVADTPEGFLGAALGWLHFGKVPILVILVIFLTTFALAGFIGQFVAKAMIGTFLPQLVAVVPAFVVGVFGVRVFGGALHKVIPRDETTAVSDASLVGRVGTIVIGTARAGAPAEARVQDEHGATHYVMVEPDEPDQSLTAGTRVLLVRHVSGRRFQAIPNPKPELL